MAKTRATDVPLPFTAAQRKDGKLADYKVQEWRADARVFAREVCRVEPDKWQDKFLAALSGPHLDPGAKRKMALKACKGPGKSFVLAIGGWWWMFTRWHANGVVMSITADNLRDNLWSEFARVQERSPELQHFFSHKGERIEAKDYAKSWWLSARSFPQNADKTQQANTLAGLHGRHPIVICDEVGDYPDGVVVAAEAILFTLVDGKPPDGRVLLAGNPTSTEGPLYRITKKDHATWWTYSISSAPDDPERTPRVDPEEVRAQIASWGIDSDFIKVNVLGEFPSQQANKLIGPDLALRAAQTKIGDQHRNEALIFGLDVAAYGDNASVLFQRQGNMSWRPRVWREINHMVLADQIAAEFITKNPAALFVDNSPVSAGLIDRLRTMGIPILAIDFGGSPMESRFYDRRSEMYFKMAAWLKAGGCIPDDIQLRQELVAPNYAMKAAGKITKMKLESKDEMKKRGISSPDMADALALTFAAPVIAPPPQDSISNFQSPAQYYQQKIRGGTEADWNPFEVN